MEVVGWLALAFVGLVGFGLVLYAVIEFFVIQFKTLKDKIECAVVVQKNHHAAESELKAARLAKKRAVVDKILNKRLELKLAKMKADANDKLGDTFPREETGAEATLAAVASATAIQAARTDNAEEICGGDFLNLGGLKDQKHAVHKPAKEKRKDEYEEEAETKSFGVMNMSNVMGHIQEEDSDTDTDIEPAEEETDTDTETESDTENTENENNEEENNNEENNNEENSNRDN